MRKLLAFIAAAALALCCVADAANTGGFPSRPRFADVGVGVPAPTPVSGYSQLAVNGSTIDASAGGGFYNVHAAANLRPTGSGWQYVANGSGSILTIGGGGSQAVLTYYTAPSGVAGGVAPITAWQVPRWSAGVVTGGASSCTLTANIQNIASCAFTSSTQLTVTFTTPYTSVSTFVCTASPELSGNGAIGAAPSGGTAVVLSAAAVNSVQISFNCFGT